MPGDPFQLKVAKKNVAAIIDKFEHRIDERTAASPGGEYEGFVAAYLAKLEREINKEETRFTRK